MNKNTSPEFRFTVLENLVHNEDFCRRALPYIKEEYFVDDTEKSIFKEIKNHIDKYNAVPTVEVLRINLENNLDDEEIYTSTTEMVNAFEGKPQDTDWLLETTEDWCQYRATYLAIMQSVKIMNGEDKTLTMEAVPTLLSDALAVSFDQHVGHDYFIDYEHRYDYLHMVENRVPFGLDILNTITKGGLTPGTLTVLLAGTNVGKSLVMCHMAADNLRLGKNVLYITCEMSEEKIASRIDANLLDLTMDDIHYMEKDSYCKRFETIRETTVGKLVVKEYPTSTANINHFRHLLHELKLKKKFVPDIIYIDYINICASSKMKNNGSTGSYQYIKTIAEEVRSFAQENKLPIVSATQLNRDGAKKKEVEITDTSESWGLPATCDFMFGLYVNHELDELGRMKWFTIKTRDADKSKFRTFLIGLDRAKMKLYDVDNEKENVDEVGETAEFNEDFEIDLKTGNLKQKLKFNI